ncbi:MAG: threonine/serine exporter family protein [Lachnospiraceae bacterium]|nr:threonine/serine exporter family protein [Lachnospiraceae bacterium]
MLVQFLVAMTATISFSVLFGVPRRYYFYCGVIGAAGWAVYCALLDASGAAIASLAATMAVIFLSRLAAIWQHCPVTIFLISGIFPLVPGAGVYWTAYYLVTDELELAVENGYQAVKIAFAIVLGIVFVFELPQKLFLMLLGRRK